MIDKVTNNKIEQNIERLTNDKLTRRQFLKSMLGLGISVASINSILAACGRPPASPVETGETPSGGTTNKGTVNYWGSPIEIPGDDWGPIVQETGWEMNFVDNGSALGPVLAGLAAGTAQNQFDIISLNRGAQMVLAPENYIVPVDPAKFPNSAKAYNYWPLNSDLYKYEGKLYGIPVMGNGDSVAYLPDKTGEITSLSALFDPDFKGKTALENRWSAALIKTAIYLKGNDLETIKDPGDMTPDELKLVADFLIEKKKEGQFRTFWNGWEDAISLLGNEEVWIMDTWEPVVYALKAEGKNVEYAWPKEGFMFWLVANYLLKGAVDRGKEQAFYDLCNFQFSGWYVAKIATVRGYLVPTGLGIEYAKAHPDEFDVAELERLQANARRKFEEYPGYWEHYAPTYMSDYEEQWQRVLSA
jgi:putative spermidine/putrescine transport system substrate-binding protein